MSPARRRTLIAAGTAAVVLAAIGGHVWLVRAEFRQREAAVAVARENGLRVETVFARWPDWVPGRVQRFLGPRPWSEVEKVTRSRVGEVTDAGVEALTKLPPPRRIELPNTGLSAEQVTRLVAAIGSRAERINVRGCGADLATFEALFATPAEEILATPPAEDAELLELARRHPRLFRTAVLARVRDRFLGHTEPEWPEKPPEEAAEMPDGPPVTVERGVSRDARIALMRRAVGVRRADASDYRTGVFERGERAAERDAARDDRSTRLTLRYDPHAEDAPPRVTLDPVTVRLLAAVPLLGKLEAERVDPDWASLPPVKEVWVDRVSPGFASLVASPRGPEVVKLDNIRGRGEDAVSAFRGGSAKRLTMQAFAGRPLTGRFLSDFGAWPRLRELSIDGNVNSRDFGPDTPPDRFEHEVRDTFRYAVAERGYEAVAAEVREPVDASFAGMPLEVVTLRRLTLTDAALRSLPEGLERLSLSDLPRVTAAGLAAAVRKTRPRELSLGGGLPWGGDLVRAAAEIGATRYHFVPNADAPPEAFAAVADGFGEARVIFNVTPPGDPAGRDAATAAYVEAVPDSRPQFARQ